MNPFHWTFVSLMAPTAILYFWSITSDVLKHRVDRPAKSGKCCTRAICLRVRSLSHCGQELLQLHHERLELVVVWPVAGIGETGHAGVPEMFQATVGERAGETALIAVT